MKTIKVLGTGCPNCIKLENNVKLALEKTGIQANIEKITDIVDIMAYDIMSNPGLVIDEKVVSSGKVCDVDEIVELITTDSCNNQDEKSCSCGGNC